MLLDITKESKIREEEGTSVVDNKKEDNLEHEERQDQEDTSNAALLTAANNVRMSCLKPTRSDGGSSSGSSSTCLTKPNDKSNNKSVSFSIIEIRYFPITIGDNPACTKGVPLTIEWKHLQNETQIKRLSRLDPTIPHRHEDALVISSLERARILRDLGYTKIELGEAIYRTNLDRRLREETIQEYYLELERKEKEERKRQNSFFYNNPIQYVWNQLIKGRNHGKVKDNNHKESSSTSSSSFHRDSLDSIIKNDNPSCFGFNFQYYNNNNIAHNNNNKNHHIIIG